MAKARSDSVEKKGPGDKREMSFRVGLDVPREEYMEFHLDNHNGDIVELSEEAAWFLPQKVFYSNWRTLLAYCRALYRYGNMPPREIWAVFRRNADGTYTCFWRHGEKGVK